MRPSLDTRQFESHVYITVDILMDFEISFRRFSPKSVFLAPHYIEIIIFYTLSEMYSDVGKTTDGKNNNIDFFYFI